MRLMVNLNKPNLNPKNPRKLKPYAVSYFLPSESVDGRYPLHVCPIEALNAEDAIQKVHLPVSSVIRTVRRAYSGEPEPKNARFVDIHGNYVQAPGKPLHVFQRAVDGVPKCPDCGAPLKKWSHFCPPCRRHRKNTKQILTKRARIATWKAKGIQPCKNCAARPATTKGRVCDVCREREYREYQQYKKGWLHEQVFRALNLLKTAPHERCNRWNTHKGHRLMDTCCRHGIRLFIQRRGLELLNSLPKSGKKRRGQ